LKKNVKTSSHKFKISLGIVNQRSYLWSRYKKDILMKVKILKPVWLFPAFQVGDIYEAKRDEDGFIMMKNPFTQEFDSLAYDQEVEVILED